MKVYDLLKRSTAECLHNNVQLFELTRHAVPLLYKTVYSNLTKLSFIHHTAVTHTSPIDHYFVELWFYRPYATPSPKLHGSIRNKFFISPVRLMLYFSSYFSCIFSCIMSKVKILKKKKIVTATDKFLHKIWLLKQVWMKNH